MKDLDRKTFLIKLLIAQIREYSDNELVLYEDGGIEYSTPLRTIEMEVGLLNKNQEEPDVLGIKNITVYVPELSYKHITLTTDDQLGDTWLTIGIGGKDSMHTHEVQIDTNEETDILQVTFYPLMENGEGGLQANTDISFIAVVISCDDPLYKKVDGMFVYQDPKVIKQLGYDIRVQIDGSFRVFRLWSEDGYEQEDWIATLCKSRKYAEDFVNMLEGK